MKKPSAKKMKTALSTAVSKTFADLAFVDVVPVTAREIPDYKPVFYINILHPLKGAIALYFNLECKKKIVENIFTTGFEEIEPRNIDDCLLELLNVLAGEFMTILYENKEDYRLDLPAVLFDEKEVLNHKHKPTACYFDAEETVFMVKLLEWE